LSIGFPNAISEAVSKVANSFVVDGESIGEVLYVFDLLEVDGTDHRNQPYRSRLGSLEALVWGDKKALVIAKTAIGQHDKRALMASLKTANKEGIVFKKLSAHWYAGRPESGGSAIKCKFWASCSCVVSKVNAKRSIEVSLEGKSIGNVTIPPNKDVPAVGQVVEIKYLYVVGVGGKLYQPIYLGLRDDVDAGECTFASQHLKYKPEIED
jgi:bifunctional non-homologous end joining protein LigD